ncbi:MAG: thioesterase family protein [Granulosicoccus sp.]
MSQPETLPGNALFHSEFSLRWGDMDALGHINNIMYFRYFEQVRIEWYESLEFGSLEKSASGMVIVDNHAEYLKPLVYPQQIHLHMAGHSPGRSSFVSTYTITADGVLYSRGSARVVWVDQSAGKSVPLPDKVRALVSDTQYA